MADHRLAEAQVESSPISSGDLPVPSPELMQRGDSQPSDSGRSPADFTTADSGARSARTTGPGAFGTPRPAADSSKQNSAEMHVGFDDDRDFIPRSDIRGSSESGSDVGRHEAFAAAMQLGLPASDFGLQRTKGDATGDYEASAEMASVPTRDAVEPGTAPSRDFDAIYSPVGGTRSPDDVAPDRGGF